MSRSPDRTSPAVTVARATVEQKADIAGMLDSYLAELSRHRDIAVGATDAASYPFFDLYWTERDRHPFVVRVGEQLGGFVFVYAPSIGVHQLAEFYIAPPWRRRGIALAATTSLWRRFPGDWELQVHPNNDAALAFWTTCVVTLTEGGRINEIDAADGRRLQFECSVPSAQATAPKAATATELRLRAATAADRELLYQINRNAMQAYVAQTWGWEEQDQRQMFRQRYDPRRLEVIRFRGHDVGFISIDDEGTALFLASVVIHRSFQRRGIGTTLISQLQEQASQRSLPVRLQVLNVNPARALYRRLGFRETARDDLRTQMIWQPPAHP